MNNLDSDIVSLKELRKEFPRYIAAMAAGRSFTVVKRSKPIFQMSPLDDAGKWQTIADFTKLSPEGVDADEILANL